MKENDKPSGHEMDSNQEKRKILTYAQAGVDIEEGDKFVQSIKQFVETTRRPEVLSGIGGFAGLCSIPSGYDEPVLVSGADGVGTKLKIAFASGRHDTVGIDLVAMCVNDVAVTGAEPLFFLDYFAAGKLERHIAQSVIEGIAVGCRQAGCALLGGETAEMPGFYPDGEYDLSGFCVGVVERKKILTGETIREGDVLIGAASSGLHSNGYSLARKVLFEELGYELDDSPRGLERPLWLELLEPTRIYGRAIRNAMKTGGLKAASHITGGGLVENPVRCLTEKPNLGLRLSRSAWPIPPIFEIISSAGVEEWEMYRTFNMGLGLVLFAERDNAVEITKALEKTGVSAWTIGEVIRSEKDGGRVILE